MYIFTHVLTFGYKLFLGVKLLTQFFYFAVFGLGTLIFTGLEIAMHATMETNCVEDIVIAHPILHALFTFLQMHFLFVNSQVNYSWGLS